MKTAKGDRRKGMDGREVVRVRVEDLMRTTSPPGPLPRAERMRRLRIEWWVMGTGYFEAGEKRAAKVRDLFAAIAPRYDLINDLQSLGMHRRWKRRVIELGEPGPGKRVLDVCCGTGDLAMAMAAEGAEVAAVDFTPEMLEIARRRAGLGTGTSGTGKGRPGREGEHPIRFIEGDAQQLPFAKDTFDIVTIGYGLRNLADWRRGLGEMHRVAKPGGRLLVLDFGKPPNAVWRGIYFAYLRCFVPVLGLAVAGNASAYRYILDSLKHYPAQDGVAQYMKELGLEQVRILSFLGGIMTINYGEKGRVKAHSDHEH